MKGEYYWYDDNDFLDYDDDDDENIKRKQIELEIKNTEKEIKYINGKMKVCGYVKKELYELSELENKLDDLYKEMEDL